MSWDEKIFGALFGRLFGRRQARLRSERRTQGVCLDGERGRARILASAVAGVSVEIQAAEAEGGTSQTIMLLPDAFWMTPDPRLNARGFLYRVLYGAVSIRLGMCAPKGSTDPASRMLATLLAVPATLEVLEREVEGACALRAELFPIALGSRPDARKMNAGSASLEMLARARLGRPWDELWNDARTTESAAMSWARAASEEAPSTAAELWEAVRRHRGGLSHAEVDAVALWGVLSPARTDTPLCGPEATAPNPSGATTERVGKPKEGARRVEIQASLENENPLVHSFEKVHTVEEHQGGSRRADGSDELDEHFDALEEANVREVVRSTEQAKSLYRSDVTFDDAVADVSDGAPSAGIPYDEWDAKLGAYRRGWCTVQVVEGASFADGKRAQEMLLELRRRERRQIDALRAQFEALALQRRWRTGQRDGSDVDVDALVDRLAALHSGHTGTDRLYVSRQKCEQNIEVSLLIDGSLSTDGWIRGRRVLAVVKETVVLLTDAFEHVGIRTSVASFHSNTRRDCRFTIVKGPEDAPAKAYRRLAAIEPAGYTRIGPALRHATSVLRSSPARKKLLLLISDGKPTDYDRYEGRHGISDVRKAAREATLSGVSTFCLAIDTGAKSHLSEMFGPTGYDTMLSSAEVVRSMIRVYADLLR